MLQMVLSFIIYLTKLICVRAIRTVHWQVEGKGIVCTLNKIGGDTVGWVRVEMLCT